MKKRTKGLIALWMALVMAVSSLVTVLAATEKTVYIYYGKEPLKNGDQFEWGASDEVKKLFNLSEFKAGDLLSGSLLDNIPGGYDIPEGYKLDGWKVWTYSSGAQVYYSETKGLGDTISSEEFKEKYVSSDTAERLVLEPVLVNHWFEHQPTNDEPYVSINKEEDGITYEWNEVNQVEYDVVAECSDEYQMVFSRYNGEYDGELKIWSGENTGTEFYLNITSNLTKGDILQINSENEIAISTYDNVVSFKEIKEGVWSGEVSSDSYVSLYVTSSTEFSVKIKVLRDEVSSVEGQNTNRLVGANGKRYYCKVTFTDEVSLISDIFTYTGHIINCNETSNGSYTVQVDDKVVEKADAGKTITVKTTPAAGYELDEIKVISTADGSTNVTVTDNSFTMPDYPVTIDVTFKKKTYAVTLPEETVSYIVESSQTTPVEHGSDYTFTVTLKDGYGTSGSFEVKANTTTLTATENSEKVYTYIIENVTAEQNITVSGVAEEHNITKSLTTNGDYTVMVGEVEVDKAIADTTVIVTAIPAIGYELDEIKVISTSDGSTTVTVTDNSFTMPDYPVTISVTFKIKTYAVTLPQKTVGYTVTSNQASPVEHGSNYIFTVTLEEGYFASSDFAVQANDTVLEATESSGNVYTYNIEKVTEAQEITVSGVADGTAPTITITLDENNKWQSFLNKISFGLFFKEAKSLTIEAEDKESGIGSVKYYLTNTNPFSEESEEDKTYTAEEIESVITNWTEYTGSISLPEDDNYVLFAKAEDKAGNVTYAGTTGIVIDTVAPVIANIEEGGTYYGDVSFTVSDDNLDSVLVDGSELELPDAADSGFGIIADNNTHTIQAADKAGNSISYQISVYETWVRDGIASEGSYKLEQGIPYKLGSGTWKVAGDDTIYEGGNTFYVQESGTYELQEQ